MRRDPVEFSVSVSNYHTNVDAAFAAGGPLPSSHPSVHALVAAALPAGHPDLDAVLADPINNPVPSWHPPFEQYVSRRVGVDLGVRPNVSIGFYHPDPAAEYGAGNAVPATHPLVGPMLAAVLPAGHPEVDALLADPGSHPLPDWHPALTQFVLPRPAVQFSVSVSGFHTNVDAAFAAGDPLPSGHPSVHALVAAALPAGHPDLDAVLADPINNPVPSWHPPFEQWLQRDVLLGASGSVRTDVVSISHDHPDIDQAFANNQAVPDGHPSVHAMLAQALPPRHPNIDAVLRSPADNPLPSWHAPLNQLVKRRSQISPGLLLCCMAALAFVVRLVVRQSRNLVRWIRQIRIAQSERDASSHHTVSYTDDNFSFAKGSSGPMRQLSARRTTNGPLPVSVSQVSMCETNVDATQSPGQTPQSHVRRPENVPQWGSEYIQLGRKSTHDRQSIKLTVHNVGGNGGPPAPENGLFGSRPVNPGAVSLSGSALPRRRLSVRRAMKRHAEHQAEEPMYPREEVRINDASPDVSFHMKAKTASATRSCWLRIFGKRATSSQMSSGTIILLACYIAANLCALLLSHFYWEFPLDRGLGTLAAANTISLVMAATRNSLLTWFLGYPFDHVVAYHRALGRITIGVSFLHFGWYFERLMTNIDQQAYWAGLAALCCGVGIAVTTTDWARRNHFNVFFWSHYLFIGFFSFAYIHAKQARPFLLASIGMYALDKFLRTIWTSLPSRTTVMRNRGDAVAQVRFPKNVLSRMMSRHKVGQYMFVNFPELSLFEWHPFSVSSGPHEDEIELHIRALGDHTRKIVALAKTCAASGHAPWIRADGPYGLLDFNYRRYHVLLLVGGGIGITPIVGLMKDIFARTEKYPHLIKCVKVIWIMPHRREADLFLETFEDHMAASRSDPSLPDLMLAVHCTRIKEGETEARAPIVAGRPNFPSQLDELDELYPTDATLVYACGPGRMVNTLWDESIRRTSPTKRYDFHHEAFEF